MAIQKAEKYIPVLDKKYMAESKTSCLDTTTEFEYIRKANTFLVPIRNLSGLGNYDRQEGFAKGNISLEYVPYTPDYERSQSFMVDVMDDDESQGLLYLDLAGQFIEENVAPEVDAVRIAKYAGLDGIHSVTETLANAEEVLASLRALKNTWAEEGVKEEERYLFISPTLIDSLDDLDAYKSRAAKEGFNIVKLPQAQLQTAFDLFDGSTTNADGSPKFGYAKNADAKAINFLAIQKKAIFQFLRHVAARNFNASANINADADLYQYRICGMADGYKNKRNGIYVSIKG